MIKLSQWAKNRGISYRTAIRWYQNDTLPEDVELIKSPTGSLFIKENIVNVTNKKIFIYCRVSSSEKKDDLSRQIERCKSFSESKGLSVDKIYKEIGSGMNDNRTQLVNMLNSSPNIIIIENKDRLTRFGFNYLEILLSKLNCEILIINKDEVKETDLMKDLVSVITSFCCRLYGLRRGYNKAKNIKDRIEDHSI